MTFLKSQWYILLISTLFLIISCNKSGTGPQSDFPFYGEFHACEFQYDSDSNGIWATMGSEPIDCRVDNHCLEGYSSLSMRKNNTFTLTYDYGSEEKYFHITEIVTGNFSYKYVKDPYGDSQQLSISFFPIDYHSYSYIAYARYGDRIIFQYPGIQVKEGEILGIYCRN